MNKLIIQIITAVALFFATLYVINKVDWMAIFKVEKLSKTVEEKLGILYWGFFEKTEKEIKNPDITLPIDSLLSKICSSNHIDKHQIQLHIVKNNEINAFALPNHHLVIYSGLISDCENEAELCGVIAHELAHMQMKHVMKKMMKEVGLTAIISISGGNANAEIIRNTAKMLSSTAYDRNLEKEADMKAVEYLIQSKINPNGFVDFLNKMADKETNIERHLVWISTHPNSRNRAVYIIDSFKNRKIDFIPILDKNTFLNVKNLIDNVQD